MSELKLPMWNIGGGIKHYYNLYKMFVDTKRYYDTSHKLFDYVYDSFFGLRWNGGRTCFPRDTYPFSTVMSMVKNYNMLGVGFNWTFSNLLLQEEDLNDDYCNLALEQTHSPMNGVILTSDILRDHIRTHYPKFRIIYSVCNGLNNLDAYKKALDENDIVVLHPDFNHNMDFLDKLPEKHRVEIMVNDICSFGCPFRQAHYIKLSQHILEQSKNPIINFPDELDYSPNKPGCMATQAGYDKDERNRITFSDIDNLLDMGFKHFKIIGREHEWDHFWERDLRPNLDQYFNRRMIKNAGLNLHI